MDAADCILARLSLKICCRRKRTLFRARLMAARYRQPLSFLTPGGKPSRSKRGNRFCNTSSASSYRPVNPIRHAAHPLVVVSEHLIQILKQSPVGGMPCRWTTCFSIVPPQTGHRRHRTTVLSQHQNDQPHPVAGKVGCRR